MNVEFFLNSMRKEDLGSLRRVELGAVCMQPGGRARDVMGSAQMQAARDENSWPMAKETKTGM